MGAKMTVDMLKEFDRLIKEQESLDRKGIHSIAPMLQAQTLLSKVMQRIKYK